MATQTEQINDLITATTALKTTFENKDADIDASVANVVADAADIAAAKTAAEADAALVATAKAQTDTDAAAIAQSIADINAAITPKLPLMNILPDGGRYAGVAADVRNLGVSAFESTHDYIVGFNGTPWPTEVGKFIHNNTDNAGSSGSMTQTTIDLIAAAGRTGSTARWGAEFFVAEYTMGASPTGTVVETDHFYMLNCGKNTIHDANNGMSFAMWLRVVSGSVALRKVNGLWVDGVEQASNKLVAPADNWIHFSGITSDKRGYISTLVPHVSAQANTVIQLALPVFCPGVRQMPIHTAPVMPFTA